MSAALHLALVITPMTRIPRPTYTFSPLLAGAEPSKPKLHRKQLTPVELNGKRVDHEEVNYEEVEHAATYAVEKNW